MLTQAVYTDWSSNIVVVLLTLVLVGIAVIIHYEGLSFLNQWLRPRQQSPRRRLLLYSIAGVICLHLVEIWLFGLGYHLVQYFPQYGYIHGSQHEQHFFDNIYFSSAVYSSVGFGDLVPIGPIRFIAGTEGLVGLVLIGWSASFTYLEMQRFWSATDAQKP